MAIGAVLCVFVAVLIGTLLLADLAAGTALRRLVASHVTLALVATVVVCAAAFTSSAPLAWLAAAVVVAAASVGVVTWRRSHVQPSPSGASGALLIAHGTAAALSIALAIVAAVRA